jgi:hypothetical protein
MIIAGFDIATKSGAAILDDDSVIHIEAFRPKGDTDAEIFAGFRAWFRPLLVGHGVEAVGIEQPLPTDIEVQDKRPTARPGDKRNPITMPTYLRLYGLRAHAVEICHTLNIECREIHQGTWRKAFTGNGRADKDQVLKLARQIVPDLKSKDASDALGVAWALRGELSPLGKTIDMFARAS